MKKFTLLLFMLFLIGINFSMKAQYVHLTLTGFNQDLIANGTNSASSSTSIDFDGNGNVYYSADFNPGTSHSCFSGLPTGGLISNSATTNNISYQLADYSGNNCLLLTPENLAGTLTISNTGSFNYITILAASAVSPEQIADFSAQLHFSDASSTTYSFTAYDWYVPQSCNCWCLSALGRVNRSGSAFDSRCAFYLYDCKVTMTPADQAKVLTSITFTKTDESDQQCGIFAVSGANVPPPVVATPGTSVTGTSFNANWDATSSTPPVTHYYLDVSTDPGFGSFVGIYNNWDMGTATTSPVTGLSPNTNYYYRLRAANSAGTGPNSNVITVHTLSCVNPTSGGTIAADQNHCGSFTPAAFTNSADASNYTGTLEYEWQYSVSPFSTWIDIASSNSNTYTPPGLITVTTEYRRLARVTCMSDWTGAAVSNTLTATVNTIPTAFNVTGGGSYCAGGTGVVVGLSGSASGVSYQLYNNGTPIGSPLTGTGALNFGLQTAAGTYTVVATNATTACTNNMSGSATVVINPLPTPVITGPTSVAMGSTANYTTPLVSGHTYVWSVVFGTFVSCGPNCITIHWPWYCNIQEPGRVTVIETNTATGCVQTFTLLVTINN
jgi:hypothetical protein